MLDEATGLDADIEYEELHQLAFHAMGSSFDLWVACKSGEAARMALSDARRFVDDAEQVMSRFREDSDLSALNRKAGQRAEVVPMLFKVIQVALEAASRSKGIYDPTVLPALVAAGYDRSFVDLQNDDAPFAAAEAAPQAVADQAWNLIELDESDHAITLPAGVQIDLGGIGKAWAAHRAADILEHTGPCIVSAGGDVTVRGEAYPGEGWFVAIKDPLCPERQIANLEVSTSGVATSGIDRRRWTRNGVTAHHIIDPRTGRPAETDLLSVTVIAPDVLIAERLALTAMVLGSQRALDLTENECATEALLVLVDGRRLHTSRFSTLLAPVGGEM